MRIGIVSSVIARPDASVDRFVGEMKKAEESGLAFVSVPNIFSMDAITAIALAGRETSRIEMATGVVPTPPRHPTALAQQALTAQAACNGRFVLGVGLSHKVVIEDMFGLSYARPAAQMREYLEVLMPLLEGRQVSHEGELYRVNAGLQVAAGTPVPVLVAALGPLMLKVAGELAHGTSTWMTGVKTLGEHTVPTICDAAKAADRPAPRILAAIPIALTNDSDKALEFCDRVFALYGTIPSYRAMLDREGIDSPSGVALVGDESALREGLQQFRDAGVTDFAASLFPADEGALARTAEFLQAEC